MTANFGMVTLGMKIRIKFIQTKNSGQEKSERNIKRDEEVNKKLENDGWTVLRFWGKEILKNPEACFQEIVSVLEKKDEI